MYVTFFTPWGGQGRLEGSDVLRLSAPKAQITTRTVSHKQVGSSELRISFWVGPGSFDNKQAVAAPLQTCYTCLLRNARQHFAQHQH